jgi:hypothetical protein
VHRNINEKTTPIETIPGMEVYGRKQEHVRGGEVKV